MNTHFWESRFGTRGIEADEVHDKGQTTAEYALVLLAAGTIAMLVVAWAQGNNAIGSLFDEIITRVTSLTA